MAIPASGPVSLAQIQTEFGGTNPISIDEYYRGGANVPAVTTTVGIPASGTISFDDFHGKAESGGGSTFTLSVTPASVFASGSGTINTNLATATPTGATGSVTYSWTYVSGDVLTVINPTGASTAFQGTVGAGNPERNAVYRCTGTDSASNTASDTVDVTLSYDGGGA